MQFVFKQLEGLKNKMTQDEKDKDFELISAPIKAHWCKGEA